MLLSTAILGLAVLGTAIDAQFLAERIPNKRAALSAGGWALTAPGGTCPDGAPVCDSGWCCPSSLTCIEGGDANQDNYCCPGSSDCLSSLQTSPACADNSWSLWNATGSVYEFDFFCCLADQAGLATGGCISASQVPAYKNQLGLLISAAIGTGTTTTSSGATATGAGSSATKTATATSSSSVTASPTGKSNNAMSVSRQGAGVRLLVQALGAAFAVGLF